MSEIGDNEPGKEIGSVSDRIRSAVQEGYSIEEIEMLGRALTGEYAQQLEDRTTVLVQTLGLIATRMAQAEKIRLDLSEAVSQVRELGATWRDIGRAASITPQAAHRRWDPRARQQHNEYQRRQSQSKRSDK